MTSQPPREDQLLGKTIAGAYRLVEIQGQGAFGTVFKAHQFFCNQFVRPVAVKISRQTGLTQESAAYLFSDALVLAQLQAGGPREGKEHLVPIYHMGLLPEEEGRGFLVMEYVEGYPLLSHIMAAGRIGVASGLRYAKEICRGLRVVHAQGAVHRDLKPDNILIDHNGVIRLIDFGLASFTDPKLGFAPGQMGTYTYMAPETMLGRSTPAADVYGVGLILYELFTGGGPHLSAPWPSQDQPCDFEDIFRIKKNLEFRPPSEVQNEIRHDFRWLDDLILRCLEIHPSRRFRDAGQLLQAMETCEQGGGLPPLETIPESEDWLAPGGPQPPQSSRQEELIRQARRLLAEKAFGQVVDVLDIHRPAEWAVLDQGGARILRLLGQAALGLGDVRQARDCLEQLQAVHKEKPVLRPQEYAAILSDLIKSYQGLGMPDQAEACRQEAR